ncbi:hypothetical protein J3E69DRAFT_335258 [Trichoderma sp. SZMC 28015]
MTMTLYLSACCGQNKRGDESRKRRYMHLNWCHAALLSCSSFLPVCFDLSSRDVDGWRSAAEIQLSDPAERERERMTCTPACTRTSAYACACTYEYSSIQTPPAMLARDWRLAAARIASLGRLAEGVLRIADLGSPRMSNSH